MNTQQDSLTRWLQSGRVRWQKLSTLLEKYTGHKDNDLDQVMTMVQGHRSLARDLSLARSMAPGSSMTRYLEQLFMRMHDIIYRQPHQFRHTLHQLYLKDIPAVVRSLRLPIISVAILFIISALASWWLIDTYPELVSLFASEEMIKSVQQGELWTDGLLNIMPSSMLSLSIMSNNIMVSLFAFALGSLYGLGTLYIITLNGFMLGGIFAYTARYDLAPRLFEFIVAHGIVELSIIGLAGAAGVQLGEALMRPGNYSRAEAFSRAVSNSGKLLAVVVPFLVGAGLIEGFVSPDPGYPLYARVIIGVCYAILLWGFLSGHIWRLFSKKLSA